MPLPTRATVGADRRPWPARSASSTNRGGTVEPWFTASRPPKPELADRLLVVDRARQTGRPRPWLGGALGERRRGERPARLVHEVAGEARGLGGPGAGGDAGLARHRRRPPRAAGSPPASSGTRCSGRRRARRPRRPRSIGGVDAVGGGRRQVEHQGLRRARGPGRGAGGAPEHRRRRPRRPGPTPTWSTTPRPSTEGTATTSPGLPVNPLAARKGSSNAPATTATAVASAARGAAAVRTFIRATLRAAGANRGPGSLIGLMATPTYLELARRARPRLRRRLRHVHADEVAHARRLRRPRSRGLQRDPRAHPARPGHRDARGLHGRGLRRARDGDLRRLRRAAGEYGIAARPTTSTSPPPASPARWPTGGRPRPAPVRRRLRRARHEVRLARPDPLRRAPRRLRGGVPRPAGGRRRPPARSRPSSTCSAPRPPSSAPAGRWPRSVARCPSRCR